MRVAVVGCGAMGGLFAAHLHIAGAEIWAVDIWEEHVAAMSAHGLAVRRDQVERTARINATAMPNAAGIADVVLVFVKSGETLRACEAARPLVSPRTLIVTLQNGLGNADRIRSVFPDNPLLFGFTPLTSEIRGPGAIEASGAGQTCMWPDRGAIVPAMEAFAALLTKGGIEAALTPDIEVEIWKKLVVNCCYNPVCALTGLTVGAAMAHPQSEVLMQGVLAEIVALAAAKGIGLSAPVAREYLARIGAAAHAHYPSMVADFRARRPTEIDSLNGAVVRASGAHGIVAPFNQSLVSLVAMAEAAWAAP